MCRHSCKADAVSPLRPMIGQFGSDQSYVRLRIRCGVSKTLLTTSQRLRIQHRPWGTFLWRTQKKWRTVCLPFKLIFIPLRVSYGVEICIIPTSISLPGWCRCLQILLITLNIILLKVPLDRPISTYFNFPMQTIFSFSVGNWGYLRSWRTYRWVEHFAFVYRIFSKC